MSEVIGAEAVGLRERKKLRTRATLIDAAVDLCNRQGFERTTVDQIAAQADVSPRTFSRYFATKDAVVLAVMEDAVELIAIELATQPADVGELDALFGAYVAVFRRAATSNILSAGRLMASARIMLTSPSLMQAAGEFRPHALNKVLAQRMGVELDDRKLRLIGAVWRSIVLTALGEVIRTSGWDGVGAVDIAAAIEVTYAQFVEVTAGVRQSV